MPHLGTPPITLIQLRAYLAMVRGNHAVIQLTFSRDNDFWIRHENVTHLLQVVAREHLHLMADIGGKSLYSNQST